MACNGFFRNFLVFNSQLPLFYEPLRSVKFSDKTAKFPYKTVQFSDKERLRSDKTVQFSDKE